MTLDAFSSFLRGPLVCCTVPRDHHASGFVGECGDSKAMEMPQRFEGTVKSWKSPWGWVCSPQLEGDLFAHEKDVRSGNLRKDAAVTFEIGEDVKSGKARALNIEVHRVELSTLPQTGGERIEGTVASWKEAWGWLSSPRLEGEIFAHREDILNVEPSVVLAVGTSVVFEVGTDNKSGKPRAQRIELSTDGTLHGTIVSWKDKWGWISSPQLAEGDVFAHREDIASGAWVDQGTTVQFVLGVDAQGRRRAKGITPLSSPPGKGFFAKGCGKGMAMPGMVAMAPGGMACGGMGMMGKGLPAFQKGGKPMGSMGPMAHMDGFGKGQPMSPAAAYAGQRMEGQVTSWRDQWGWIACPLFVGRDIFAHAENTPGGAPLEVGMLVSFTVGNDSKGRLRALDIQVADGLSGPMNSFSAVKMEKKRATPLPINNGMGMTDDGAAMFEGSEIQGEVSSWNSPWGWITCPDFEGDVFAHKQDVMMMEELSVGQPVSFTLARDAKSGRWRALQIGPPHAPPTAKRMRM